MKWMEKPSDGERCREKERKSRHNVVTFLFDFYTGAAWLAPTGTAEDTPDGLGGGGGRCLGFFGLRSSLVRI